MATQKVDVLLVGGGIMGTTLATLISELDDSRSILLVEQDRQLGRESSDAWNNAGTGHAGYCELNYTPQASDGSVAVGRALSINEHFETSLQLWSSLVRQGVLPEADQFIRKVPHLSWIQGASGRSFLKRRQTTLSKHPLFEGMEYSDDPATLQKWLPLVAGQRNPSSEPMAATRTDHGSDVNFGALTRSLGDHLQQRSQFQVQTSTRVIDLKSHGERWLVCLENLETHERSMVDAGFVFIGAGGASLPLLQKAGVPEARGYGGFPVSGIWLTCENPSLASQHNAKVYSQAAVGAPPMSVPHLDTRYIDGKAALLFGPFAGFTTKFLKAGSALDLPRSIRGDNLTNMLHVAGTQRPLTSYLIREALSSREQRLAQLQTFLPELDPTEWKLRRAGQRVQIIKTGPQGRGVLEFGTEVLSTQDGSLAAILGASPGASTCVSAMLDVIERCLPDLVSGHRRQILTSLIPGYGQSLKDDADLLRQIRSFTHPTLGLTEKSELIRSRRNLTDVDRNTERNAQRGTSGSDNPVRRTGTA
ncbi:malate dehydrogenase (quinone) [uncultured Marinobacter sp.]|uniref:malate dehydrogenase (quinone) n=1 Tax=uncultured Marinobacter sp. TaxID=187379 RepID=UPI0030DAA953